MLCSKSSEAMQHLLGSEENRAELTVTSDSKISIQIYHDVIGRHVRANQISQSSLM